MNDMNCPHTQNIFLRYLAGPAPSPGASLLAVGAGSGDPAYKKAAADGVLLANGRAFYLTFSGEHLTFAG